MRRFKYIKAFNSPFKRPKLKWYFGKVATGTPYFYPRRWADSIDKPGYKKAVPKKIGFDFVGLGYKTKWDDTDYRFEWSPLVSFVFFKWQIAVMVTPEEQNHYWEAWLYYENDTDKTKSPRDRIEQCKEEFPLIYTTSNGKERKTVNYYDIILRDKYK